MYSGSRAQASYDCHRYFTFLGPASTVLGGDLELRVTVAPPPPRDDAALPATASDPLPLLLPLPRVPAHVQPTNKTLTAQQAHALDDVSSAHGRKRSN